MGCCSGNKVGDAKASTDGPDHPMKLGRRGCTDCLCLILFVIFWAGMAFIAYLGVTFGDANALVYGQDYMANRCGVGAYADRPKVYYPRIDEDMIAQSVIVSSGQLWRVKLYGLCLAECPTVSSPQQCVDNPTSCIIEDYGTAEQGSKADAVGWFATLPTRDVLNRCIPTKHSEAYGGPERCVWPACDNVTNTWMTCDPEFPNTWLVAEAPFYKQGECEVKMSMMTTVVLQDTSTSVLTEQIAEHMTAVSRVAESLWESRWYILAFGVGLPIVMGMIWCAEPRPPARARARAEPRPPRCQPARPLTAAPPRCRVILLRLFAKTIVYCMIVLMGILLIATTLYLFWASDVFPEVNEFLDNTTAVEMGSGTLGSLGDSASSLLGDAADTANSTLTAIVRLVPDELDQQIAAASVSGDMKTMMQIASWVMLIITLIYIIVICISRRKIVICVTVVKEATKAVKAQPLMMVFPLWMMTAQVRAAANRHACPRRLPGFPTLPLFLTPSTRAGGAPRLRPLHLRVPRQRRAHRRLVHRPSDATRRVVVVRRVHAVLQRHRRRGRRVLPVARRHRRPGEGGDGPLLLLRLPVDVAGAPRPQRHDHRRRRLLVVLARVDQPADHEGGDADAALAHRHGLLRLVHHRPRQVRPVRQ